MFPSLVNCTTIDWFTEWPHDALEKVASKFLEDMDMDDEVNMTKQNIHNLIFFYPNLLSVHNFFDPFNRRLERIVLQCVELFIPVFVTRRIDFMPS